MPYSNHNNGSTKNLGLQTISHQQQPDNKESLRIIAHVIYAFYACFWLSAGISMLIGVIIAYVKRKDAYGSFYETHLDWQIKTFWIAFFIYMPSLILAFILIGYLFIVILAIWLVYRIIKGWLALYENKPLN